MANVPRAIHGISACGSPRPIRSTRMNVVHTEVMNRPGITDAEKRPDRTGYAHTAFSVGSRENVDELTERLRADGYKVLSGPRTTGDGYYESCAEAIEGNLVEITV